MSTPEPELLPAWLARLRDHHARTPVKPVEVEQEWRVPEEWFA